MRQTKIAEIEFDVEGYVAISNFKDLIKKIGSPSIAAAIIGCTEGIIKPSYNKSYYSFAGIFKIKSSSYTFLDICNFINKNKSVYNYIVNYYNLWHSDDYEEFSYDEFNKEDLINNFYELISMLYSERNIALNLDDNKAYEEYSNVIDSFLD